MSPKLECSTLSPRSHSREPWVTICDRNVVQASSTTPSLYCLRHINFKARFTPTYMWSLNIMCAFQSLQLLKHTEITWANGNKEGQPLCQEPEKARMEASPSRAPVWQTADLRRRYLPRLVCVLWDVRYGGNFINKPEGPLICQHIWDKAIWELTYMVRYVHSKRQVFVKNTL